MTVLAHITHTLLLNIYIAWTTTLSFTRTFVSCTAPQLATAFVHGRLSALQLLRHPHELWCASDCPSLRVTCSSLTIDGAIMRKATGGYPPRRPPRATVPASSATMEDFSAFAALRHAATTHKSSMNDLEVVGRPAIIYESDEATETADDVALMPWEGDADLLIDRFDVRHLLDSIRLRRLLMRARHGADEADVDDDTDENELDEERYRDLVAREEGMGRREDGGAHNEGQGGDDVIYGDTYGEQNTVLMELKHTYGEVERT